MDADDADAAADGLGKDGFGGLAPSAGLMRVVVVEHDELVLGDLLGIRQRAARSVGDIDLELAGGFEGVGVEAAGVLPIVVVVPGDEEGLDAVVVGGTAPGQREQGQRAGEGGRENAA